MASALPIALAAPVVGLGLAFVLPRRRRSLTAEAPQRVPPPVVFQRGDSSAQLLTAMSVPPPAHATPTTTRDVYRLTAPCDVSAWPALVTLGRIGDEEVLVDLTQVGVLSLTGDPAGAMSTLRSVWSELRWPADARELEVIGAGGPGLPGLRTTPWPNAITLLERGPERSRPLVILAVDAPTDDEALRLAAAARPGNNVGVLLVGEWDSTWQLRHGGDQCHLMPLGLDLTQLGPCDALRRASEPAAPAREGVCVSLLGPVEVLGRSLSAKETELVAFLATRPGGATEAQIRTALWPDRDAPRGTFNNLVCATRRHLGAAEDGERLLPRVVDGRYRLHPSIGCDLLCLEAALERSGKGGSREELTALLLSLRGRPFDGWSGTDWPFDDAVASRAEVLITRAARLVAGEPHGDAIQAVTRALEAVPDPTVEDALRRLLTLAN